MDSNWGDYGLASLALGTVLSLVGWWVKASRTDLKESHKEFVGYVREQGSKQTEAIVASTVATQQATKAIADLTGMITKNDERSALRHDVIAEELETISTSVKRIETKLDG